MQILVAATRLPNNTAITEFQGKYLLASQWNAQQPATGQIYLPYVLQYHMPKEGLTVCVDARTYGNHARFTRRCCCPNAEVSHFVVLVSTVTVDREISRQQLRLTSVVIFFVFPLILMSVSLWYQLFRN